MESTMKALFYFIFHAVALTCFFFSSETFAFPFSRGRLVPRTAALQRQHPSKSPVKYLSPTNLWCPARKPESVSLRDRSAVGPLQASSSPPSPLIKLASSPIGALIVLSAVVLFHEGGHYLCARAFGVHAEEFSVGVGPKLLGFHHAFDGGGEEFNLRALLIGGYVRFPAAELLQLPWQERVLISSAGIIFNLLLAFFIFAGQIILGSGIPELVLDPGVLVSAVAGPDAAASGILSSGDVIVAVNGVPLAMSQSPSVEEAQKAINSIIETVQATPDGESLQLSILRPNKRSPKSVNVRIKPKRMSTTQLGTAKPGPQTMGVFLEPNVVGEEFQKPDSFLEAAGVASKYVFALSKETATGLYTFAGDLLSGKAGTSEYRLSGPIGVIKTASNVVATQNWNTVLTYAAAISINLGVLNSFPIPPSDGFQIVFTLAEELFSRSQS